jgi:hypothetical protein
MRAGRSLEEIAANASDLDIAELRAIEASQVELDDAQLAHVAAAYGLKSASIVPPRSKLIIDTDEGILRVDGRRGTTGIGDGEDRSVVLARYLALVCSMRGVKAGTTLPLRLDDLDVLGKALRVDRDLVTADLEALMSNPADAVGWRQRMLRRKVLLPAAGILVTFCGAAALLMVDSAGAEPAVESTPTEQVEPAAIVTAPVEIGTAISQERNEDGTPGPEVVRGTADDSEGAGAPTGVGGAFVVER